MESFQVFADIPNINITQDGLLNSGFGWPAFGGDLNQMNYSRQPTTKLVTVFGQEIPIDNSNTQDMSSMQRFLHGPERPPFAYLPTDRGRSCGNPLQNRHLDYNQSYEAQSPWPVLNEYPRQCSPDETILSASTTSWSASPRDELRSSSMYAPYSARSPSEFDQHRLSYPEQSNITSFPGELPSGGGSCALREIQFSPDEEPEQSVEEYERPDMKTEYGYEQEGDCKMEVDSDNYPDHDDTGLDNSLREAESVHPVSRDGDASDSEYQPVSTSPQTTRRSRRRTSNSSNSSGNRNTHKRGLHGRKTSSASSASNSHKVNKKTRSSASASSGNGNNSNAARPFPCPLAPYSCPSTFASKNEWKRHVSTQHIRLGFWRCDLCPTTVDSNNATTVYFNDFNRKDLFTQHLRRMHAAPAHQAAGRSSREYPVTEESLSEHQARCYKQVRSAPPQSTCLFCNRTFSGPGSWDERMEHVGRHLEKERKAGGAPVDINDWQEDEVLKDWLISEGLVEADRSGSWRLGDGRLRREADDDDDDEDAEDEDDEKINLRRIKLEA